MKLDARWRAFIAIAWVFITVVFATSMSFLLLSAISDEFDVTLGTVSWVVIIESLIVAACLLPMGGVGDRLGRRRVLTVGIVLFGIGSVLTGLAPSFTLVIAARIVTSFGNALTQSVSTGLLVGSFPPEERGLAMGAQTTAVAVGSASGPFLTGLLLGVLSWRTIFALLAVPSLIAALLVLALIEPDPPSDGSGRRLNVPSAALSALAITVVVFTVNNPLDLAWLSWPIAAGALLTVALSVGYVRWELASAEPMLDLRLFRIGALRTAVMVRWVGFVASTVMMLLLPILLISVLRLQGWLAGLVLSFMAIGTGVSAQISGRLYDRIGPRRPTMVGLGLQAAVMVALMMTTVDTWWVWLAVAAFTQGIASGLWNVPNNSAMMGAIPPASFGVGGAFTNVTRTLGNVFGQAMAAAVVVAVLRQQGFDIPLGEIEDTPGAGPSFIDGWRVALAIGATLTLTLAAVAARLGWSDENAS